MAFTFVEWNGPNEQPEGFEDFDFHEERCEECGGKIWSTGGRHHYNGNYNCYTMYLHCENCGPYEVECV